MRVVRRLGGLLSGGAGVTGLVLCVAGLVGVWVGYIEVVRRVDRVFVGADQALADVQESLRRATNRLRETESELEGIRQRETQPPAQRGVRRAVSRKAVEAVGPGVGEAREMLVKASEAALVANGFLDALGEFPVVERVQIDTDRLKQASAQLGDVTERTTRLAGLLAQADPAGDEQLGGESSRAVEAVRRPIALADAASNHLNSSRERITAGHARAGQWIIGIAVALTVVLLWIAAGQLSLAIHGWKWIRR